MQWTEDALQRILIDVNLSKRYYSFYEERLALQGSEGIDPRAVEAVMTNAGFTYHKKDRFYRLTETSGDRFIGLNVAFAKGSVELILGLGAGGEKFGSPMAKLAREIETLANPSFSYSPPAPKIPYATREDLREVIDFAIRLYDDVKARLFAA